MVKTIPGAMKGVKYIGQVWNQSGYAEAARNYILALHELGVPVTVEAIRHNDQRPDLGRDGRVLASLVDRSIEYDRIILHDTPDTWVQRLRDEPPGIPTVGCTVWETSQLHPIWTRACNGVDEVWVPSRWNAEVFRHSGVRAPIEVVPHCIELPDPESIAPAALEGIPEGAFVFYSIFHWHERKNPLGLLAAYLAAFSGVHDVVLVLKTYFDWARPAGTTDTDERSDAQRLQDEIAAFKRRMKLAHYPRIVPLTGIYGRREILGLHRRGDAFVLLQRAEGWGLPHIEAAAMGKPVVTTAYGGQTDFLGPDTAYLVDYTLRPVWGMEWSFFYDGTQRWAEPDLGQAVELLRRVHANRSEAAQRGARARENIARHLTRDAVGRRMIERLEGLRSSQSVMIAPAQ
jgi:glycosyltransferase involved in cell wall biosynthesis